MGDKFEVWAYRKVRSGMKHDRENYELQQVHRSNNLIRAVAALIRAKRKCGYVRLEWRG